MMHQQNMPRQHPLQLKRPTANITRVSLHFTMHEHDMLLQITVSSELLPALVTGEAARLVRPDVLLQAGGVQEAFGAVRAGLQLERVCGVPVLVQRQAGAEAAVAEHAVKCPRLARSSAGSGSSSAAAAPATTPTTCATARGRRGEVR